MRKSLTAILAGAAVVAGAALLTPALARDGQPHVLNIRLPDGTIEQIQYTGDVPPRVVLNSGPVEAVTPPFDQPAFGPFGPSFAALERISAMLDRQAEMMLRQAATMPALLNGPIGNLPQGVHVYSMSSTIGGNGVCMHSTQITYNGDAKPQVVSHTSGNCAPQQDGAGPAGVNGPAPVPPPANSPRTIEVKANGGQPTLAMAQPVFRQH